jgi:pimeloyl-ACP methyl ester carboxylesterase
METTISRRFCAASICLFAAAAIFGQTDRIPRFEKAPCAIAAPAGERVDCGYLVVRESRSSSSRSVIRLPIAILKSDSSKPKPDPVLRTLGGPGGSSLRLIRGRRSSPWLKDRDMIIFEQRGTRYAQPSLECPEVDQARIESNKQLLDRSAARNRELGAARACFQRLSQSGIQLSAYNSSESAADIEDLRKALGLEKINLYGVSYSARLMLDVMRRFPAGIRSVVLESTLPPEVNYDEVGVDGIVRSLDELFKGCRDDAECAQAFPNLEKEFYAVVARFNASHLPVSLSNDKSGSPTVVELSGDDFATWIVDYLFSDQPASTAEAPMVIHGAFEGNYEAFRKYANDKVSTSFYSWGMRYSVWCVEEMPFEDRKAIAAQSAKYKGLLGYEVMSLPEICGVWKVKPAAAIENKSVVSSIPTLVLAAQYDAYTSPEWGRAVSKNLRNSFFFEIPWAGHGPAFSVPCVSGMIASFIEDPTRDPNDECVAETRSKFKFLTKKGP